MKRRNFLKSAIAAVPAVLIESGHAQSFAPASQTSSMPVGQAAQVVPAGEDRFGEIHPRGFSFLQFKVCTQETGGGMFVLEHSNLVPGGPPLHLHPEQEEWFYVIGGDFLFQIGEKRMQLKVGDSVLAPRDVPHTFTAVGTKPAKLLIAFSPAGRMEQFFRDATKPDAPPQDAAFYSKYGMKVVGPQLKAS